MKLKVVRIVLGFSLVVMGALAGVGQSHSHKNGTCPKNPNAHAKCSKPKSNVAKWQDSGAPMSDGAQDGPGGVDYEGCSCIFDCFGTPAQLRLTGKSIVFWRLFQ